MYKLLFVNLLLTLNILASDIIATVNGKAITRQDADRFLAKSFYGANYSMMTPKQQRTVIDKLIERELYLSVAKKEGIERDPQFAIELKKLKENLMLDLWMKKRLDSIRISNQEIWNYYVTHDSEFHRSAMASARHILVTTKDEAKEIIRELEASFNLKAKFIELAKTRSTGPSAKNGGDLGWFRKDQMVPEFSEAVFRLRKGEITHTPVHTPFGWHVIYLTDKKPAGRIEFAKVKARIENTLKLKRFKEDLEVLSKKLKKSARISVK